MREIGEELQPILIQWLRDNWKCGASGTQESKGEPQEQIVCFSWTSGESRGKQWNLYFKTAWKLNSNSAFVAQVSPKPICLQKELKRCYKPYIFLNKGWPRLSTPVSNCIRWNCAPALWDAEVRRGIRGAKHPQLSAHRVRQDHSGSHCASSTFWDVINMLSCRERRLPGCGTAPAQALISWAAEEEAEGFAGARQCAGNVNESNHVISLPSLPPCLPFMSQPEIRELHAKENPSAKHIIILHRISAA